MASRIRLLLADDQVLFRQGLRTILESEPDLQVVGEAGDGLEAVELTRTRQPDVVLMDIRMPRMDGVEATRRIREAGGAQVVILSTYDDDELVFEALRVGAAGYLLKDFPAEELIKAIRTVHHGGGVLISTHRRQGGGRTPAQPRCYTSTGAAHRTGGGDPGSCGQGVIQPGDRRDPAPERGHGEEHPEPDLCEARGAGPHPGRTLGGPARSRATGPRLTGSLRRISPDRHRIHPV